MIIIDFAGFRKQVLSTLCMVKLDAAALLLAI